jgi:hypothetical protein
MAPVSGGDFVPCLDDLMAGEVVMVEPDVLDQCPDDVTGGEVLSLMLFRSWTRLGGAAAVSDSGRAL